MKPHSLKYKTKLLNNPIESYKVRRSMLNNNNIRRLFVQVVWEKKFSFKLKTKFDHKYFMLKPLSTIFGEKM